MVKLNNRAQIGSGMSLMFLFLILVFILFLYVLAVLIISGSDFVGDLVQGREDVSESSLKEEVNSLIYEKEFYNLMNKEIDFNGKKDIERAILHSLEEYSSVFSSSGENSGRSVREIFGIDNLPQTEREFLRVGFSEDDFLKIQESNELLGELISEELFAFCLSADDEVLLGIPQGVITENGFKFYDDFSDEIFVESKKSLEIGTPVINHDIYYNSDLIEIKFRMPREC